VYTRCGIILQHIRYSICIQGIVLILQHIRYTVYVCYVCIYIYMYIYIYIYILQNIAGIARFYSRLVGAQVLT